MTHSSNPQPHIPPFEPSSARVEEQLKRLLAHPLFTNSKRYPVLLAYVVEQSLKGASADLKERTIGIEAFGREPGYDVNIDPVVRMTAAEVRKRLVQYYYAPEHAGQLVIELPLGSYAPTFRAPAVAVPEAHLAAEPHAASPTNAEPQQVAATAAPFFVLLWQHRLAASFLLLATLALGFAAGRIPAPHRPSNLERFWAPITSSAGRITYCLGEPTDQTDRERGAAAFLSPAGSLNVSDVITLARSIVPIIPRESAFRVVAAPVAQFTQLREGPNVLIGAFDNQWTMRLTQNLPYGFRVEDGQRRIVDHSNPQKNFWTMQWQGKNGALSADYAVIARWNDSTTGQPIILIGGILAEGTEAAGELVSNPAAMDALLASASSDWDKKNLEAVVETQVIDGHPGPPRVVAFRTW